MLMASAAAAARCNFCFLTKDSYISCVFLRMIGKGRGLIGKWRGLIGKGRSSIEKGVVGLKIKCLDWRRHDQVENIVIFKKVVYYENMRYKVEKNGCGQIMNNIKKSLKRVEYKNIKLVAYYEDKSGSNVEITSYNCIDKKYKNLK